MKYNDKPTLGEQLLVASPAIAGLLIILAILLRAIIQG